jgi:PKD repeat protein
MSILVGNETIFRWGSSAPGYTYIDPTNPCSGSEDINTFYFLSRSAITGMKIGSFYQSGITNSGYKIYTCREAADVGDFPIVGLNKVKANIYFDPEDCIGFFTKTGEIARTSTDEQVGITEVFAGDWCNSGVSHSYASISSMNSIKGVIEEVVDSVILDLSVIGSGTTSLLPGSYEYPKGSYTPEIECIPNLGWHFDHWEMNGATVGNLNPRHILMDTYKDMVAVFVKDDIITPSLPVADFSVTTDKLTANFTDLSLNSPDTFVWNFGDGSGSSEQNPSYTYTKSGTYVINLTVSNSYGNDSVEYSVTVSEGNKPFSISKLLPFALIGTLLAVIISKRKRNNNKNI